MPILIAAVIAVGGLCLLDLLLTFGVIRRLREHTDILSNGPGAASSVTSLEPGQSPAAFTAVTTSGELVTGATGLRVAAFFSSSCSACPERVAPFLAYLSRHHMSRDSVLAVVSQDDSAPAPYLGQLAEAAQACAEPENGEIAQAFGVTGFPAFCLLDADGAVLASGYDPAALPEPAMV
jgi:hypothetical protein